MLDSLGDVARRARLDAELAQVDIASGAGVSRAVVTRFELGERWPESGVDCLLAVYAQECGVEVKELWARALEGI